MSGERPLIDATAAAASGARAERWLRTAVVGMSDGPTCGVRDYAVRLGEALRDANITYSLHWLGRGASSLRGARCEIRAWTRRLSADLERRRPDAALLHYSVFAYSYRGLPLLVGPTLSALRRSRVPVLTVAHEFAYPWRYTDPRGDVWALTQRIGFIDVVRSSAALLLTTEARAEWLASRPWLPRRPLAVAPVFSTLPAPRAAPAPKSRSGGDAEAPIGLFGYSYEGAAVSLVLDAIRRLRQSGTSARLVLLGAPGRSSAAGEAWSEQARARGIERSLRFSGILEAQALSDALAQCEILLFADASGPSSRKTTLAASLASGRPVIAIDGPARWAKLVQAGAAEVVAPDADALARAIAALLADRERRETLGLRGRAFAEQEMSLVGGARAVRALLDEVLA